MSIDFWSYVQLTSLLSHTEFHLHVEITLTLFITHSVQGLSSRQLDILVENSGRVNFGHPLEVRKGPCSLAFVFACIFTPLFTLSPISIHSFSSCPSLPLSPSVWPSRIASIYLSFHSPSIPPLPPPSLTGISGSVEVDGKEHKDWKIYSFEFKSSFVHE